MRKLLILTLILVPVSALLGRDISLTVYNSNLALIHDVRMIDFKKGTFIHDFTDIPSRIIPTSVHFHADKVSVLEQNYEYDLASADKIRQKFIGTKIRAFKEDGTMFEGVLQPSAGGSLVLVDDDGKVLIIQSDKIVHTEFPRMPENFIERPTLIWMLNSASAGERKSEVSYLTEGMNWHAEYVAVTGQEKLSFTGWVSIDNHSGATFENAKLKLMAGDVHIVQPKAKRYERRVTGSAFMAEDTQAPQFLEKSFFEYHLYTLQRPSTLKNNQIKQISLFPEAKVAFEQEYVFDTRLGTKIKVYLVFKNSKKSGLGMPLPGGKIRVYQQDDDGTQEFVGEDLIEHTPRDEEVKILVGEAFDLVGEKVQVDTRTISPKVRELDYKIALRNHKDTEVEIIIREYLHGDWKIISSTHDYKKIDAYTIEFTVKTPPHKEDEETQVKYTVRFTRR